MNLELSRPIVSGDYHTNVKHVSISTGMNIGIDMSFLETLSVDADYYVVNSPEGVQLLTEHINKLGRRCLYPCNGEKG